MTDTALVRQEVEPGKADELKEWLAEVSDRTDEVVETLRDEGVKTESVFLEESDRGTFLVTYMEAEDLQAARRAFEESTREIDVEHRQTLQECLADGQPAGDFELCYHATNPDR